MTIIENFEAGRPYRYLWMKYVTGVNLNVHCAKCLLGDYEAAFSGGVRSVRNLALRPAPVYYLCGVAEDRIWSHNLHVAFVPSEGDTIEINNDFCHLRIKNAKRIAVNKKYIDWHLPQATRKEFSTCRNWQFASMFASGILEPYTESEAWDMSQPSLFDL